MPEVLFHKVDYTLNKLLEDIAVGEIGLPDIQRPFVWSNAKVRDLFDSMYRGYPIGYFLFWENGLPGEHRVIGTDRKQKAPRLLIVDGQQRLTSLYAVLKGVPVVRKDYRKERITIAFHPKEQKFEVSNSAIRKNPEWIADISELWSREISRNRFVKQYLERLRQAREVSDDEEDEIIEAIDRLYDLQNYPLTVLEISARVSEEQVAEIFVRINSQGKALNQADFILTLMSVFWDEGRAELEAFCRWAKEPPSDQKPSPYNPFLQPDPDQLLRVEVALGFRRARLEHVYSLLRGKDLETKKFSAERRDAQFARLREAQAYTLNLTRWHDFFQVLKRAGYRGRAMISSQNAVLYTYALYLIGERDYGINPHTLREALARWFFMASLTGRYTTSPETRMEQDLALLRGVGTEEEFLAALDREIDAVLTEDYWTTTLPNELATASAQSPGFFAYLAALCLLDARVLYSDMKVSDLLDPLAKGPKAAIDRHHLFPRKYLERLGIKERRLVNQVANFAPVEWRDNVAIGDKPPAEYVPEYEKRFSREELQQMYLWHGLPERWYELEYSGFLEERRRRIAAIIREGFKRLG